MGAFQVTGAGLGLRRELVDTLASGVPQAIDFLELAPENWMDMGGRRARALRTIRAQRPLVAHGLSLSLGSSSPLDEPFLVQLKRFLDEQQIELYTEHLSWCSHQGHLYDLLPIPLTAEAVEHVVARIRRTQEILQRRIAIENASYYTAPPGAQMEETGFIGRIVEQADCYLHLDVNNVYVNSCNFGFDPQAFISALPLDRVVYMHVAGHHQEPDGVLIDTHGAAVIDPVWQLLEYSYQRTGVVASLLERDFNIPDLPTLLREVDIIRNIQARQPASHVIAA
jgi:uncharacterized protein (UPF0276 family)